MKDFCLIHLCGCLSAEILTIAVNCHPDVSEVSSGLSLIHHSEFHTLYLLPLCLSVTVRILDFLTGFYLFFFIFLFISYVSTLISEYLVKQVPFPAWGGLFSP